MVFSYNVFNNFIDKSTNVEENSTGEKSDLKTIETSDLLHEDLFSGDITEIDNHNSVLQSSLHNDYDHNIEYYVNKIENMENESILNEDC